MTKSNINGAVVRNDFGKYYHSAQPSGGLNFSGGKWFINNKGRVYDKSGTISMDTNGINTSALK